MPHGSDERLLAGEAGGGTTRSGAINVIDLGTICIWFSAVGPDTCECVYSCVLGGGSWQPLSKS